MSILETMYALKREKRKAFAVLLDPDKLTKEDLPAIAQLAQACQVDFFFVGGSLLTRANLHILIPELKSLCNIPVVLFPGSPQQVEPSADAILLLSLISGRNPELLIGSHVVAAPILKQSQLEIMPTGYMLVHTGKLTTVHYVSNTTPIPYDKPDIAACTAMAGEMLGLKLMYLDGGSGAHMSISSEMVQAVAKHVDTPIIVGGGIRSGKDAERIWQAGADVVVIGNALEKDSDGRLMREIAAHKNVRVKS